MKRSLNSPIAALILFSVLLLVLDSAYAAPYCLLRKPFFPPQPNCFEFYLADTAIPPPRQMATAACIVTDYAMRQGWGVDPSFPAPLPNWSAGDAAMGVVSPYHSDRYGCRGGGASGNSGAGGGGGVAGGAGSACQTVQRMNQPESRDATGRITVEAAIIHVMSCPGGVQMYIYQYLNRPGFRAIRPPDWGHAIGGQDFPTIEQAQQAAATGGQAAPPPPPPPPPQPQTVCPDGSIALLGVCSQR